MRELTVLQVFVPYLSIRLDFPSYFCKYVKLASWRKWVVFTIGQGIIREFWLTYWV